MSEDTDKNEENQARLQALFNKVLDEEEDEDRDPGLIVINSLFGPFPQLEDSSPKDITCQIQEHNDHDMCLIYEKRLFRQFMQDIKKATMTREDEIRQHLSGKKLFGPFHNHPDVIDTVTARELTATYYLMFPKCPELYLNQKAEETVDDLEKQSAFIVKLCATGVPPTEWLEALEEEELELVKNNPWVRTWKKHTYLVNRYPLICPDYLLNMVKTKSDEEVYTIVLDTLFNPMVTEVWPTREQYNQRKRDEALIEQYLSVFDPEEMFRTGNDPVKHYGNKARQVSQKHSDVNKWFLMKELRYIPYSAIKAAMRNCNNVFFASFQELQKYSGPRRESPRRVARLSKLPNGIELEWMKEVQFARNAQNYKKYLKSRDAIREKKLKTARAMNLVHECASCLGDNWLPEEMLACPSGHWFCYECARLASQISVAESNTWMKCFSDNCNTYFSLHSLQKVIAPELFCQWLKKIQVKEAESAFKSGLAACPFCAYVALYDQAPEENCIFVCANPECGKESCRLCKEPSHLPLKCEGLENSKVQVRMRCYIEEKMTGALLRHCNKCKKAFLKHNGCNMMHCTCGNGQCYLCGLSLTSYGHFHIGKCKLFTNDQELKDKKKVKQAALLAKVEMAEQNPHVTLIVDPTKPVLKPQIKK